jgi:hypothetical protein
VGLPKNLSRFDQLMSALGFNGVLRLPQPKQAQPNVLPVTSQSLMEANEKRNLPKSIILGRKRKFFRAQFVRDLI